MKKCFFYAGALAMLLSSCSNDDVPTGPVQGSGGVESAVRDLTIAISGSTETRSGVSQNGQGTENQLNDTYVFVSADPDGPDVSSGTYDYEYTFMKLTGAQRQAVVKYAEAGSRVYVLSNMPTLDDTKADFIRQELNKKGTSAAQRTYMEGLEGVIDKSYLASLNISTGSFAMSGYNDVPNSTSVASVLPIQMQRDLAKVRFNVERVEPVAPSSGDFKVKAVKKISVRRAAQRIAPFKMNGYSWSSYALNAGFGEAGYVQDGLSTAGTVTPDNSQASTGATDYTFDYEWLGKQSLNYFEFDPFYVFPNAAELAGRGTIIVLEAEIQEYDGGSWVDVTGSRFYKARVSENLLSFNTQKNAHYMINAKIIGKGTDKPGGNTPDSPDAENPDSNLSITVSVDPWTVISSDQDLN